MTETITEKQKLANYAIDRHKLATKYLPRFLDGESNIEKYLPSMINTNGLEGREAYDYRLGIFKKKNPNQYNAQIHPVICKIGAINTALDELVLLLAACKIATDEFHQKNRQRI